MRVRERLNLINIFTMAKRIQNNVLVKNIVTQSVLFGSNSKLTLAWFDAFQFFYVKPPAEILGVCL